MRLPLRWGVLAGMALLVGCEQTPPPAPAPLALPALAARIDRIDEVRIRGAGGRVLVTLHKQGGAWRVLERDNWPATPGLVDTALFALSRAHLAEGKTDQAKLYPRLGVEDVSRPDAQGVEIRMSGGGPPMSLVVGKEHPKLDGNYVRVDGQARAWLTDVALSFERQPDGWIDRSLIDLPMARIAEVRVEPNPGKAFVLAPRGGRFWPQDAPGPAATATHAGDALAGVLDQLAFDDLSGAAAAAGIDRRLQFIAVDGRVVDVQLWRVQGRVWARFSASLDAARATAWRAQAGAAADANAAVGKALAEWQQRFAGHAFELPAYQASILYTSRDQILARTP